MNGGDSSRRLRPPRAIQRISNISQQNSILQTPNTPRFGILKKDTCSTPLASTPKFKTPLTKEKFVKSVKFDFDEAKEKPNTTARFSIMDVDLLDANQRAAFIAHQKSIQQTPKALTTPKTPKLGTIKESDADVTPETSTPKFRSKTPLTGEKFVKSVKFDFEEAKEKPNTSRSSIMDVNLLNHVQRSAFIAQQRSANQSLKASRFETIKEQDIPESSTPKRSKMSVVKEEFVSASKFDFDKTKEKPILARPSIMEVNLLDPVQRAAFIAQRREYDRQRRQVSSFKSDNEKENM